MELVRCNVSNIGPLINIFLINAYRNRVVITSINQVIAKALKAYIETAASSKKAHHSRP